MEINNFKVKNGFKVHQFMVLLPVDFIFAEQDVNSDYTLLNASEFGTTARVEVDKLKQKHRVVIINNNTLNMTTYNIEESEVLGALLEMK